MSVTDQVDLLAERIAEEFKIVRSEIGTGGAGAPSRTITLVTTETLAELSEEITVIDLAKAYRLLTIETNIPARVRLYTTADQQVTDLSRPIGTDPTGNHGLMLEYVTTTEVLSAALSPAVDGANLELTPSSEIPISIQNLSGSTAAIQVSFVFLGTE